VSLAFWMLLGFVTWTLLLMVIGIGVYRWTMIFRGAAELTSFPGDVPHGSVAYRRLVRAHANCLENLPVFAVIVLVGAVTGLHPAGTDALAATTMGALLAHAAVHAPLHGRP